MLKPDTRTRATGAGAATSLHAVTLPLMGIPVRFESGDVRPIEIAREAFGAWESLGPDSDRIDERPVVVRTSVIAGDEGPERHAPIDHLVTGQGRLLLTTPGSRAVSDVARREAEIHVTETLLSDRQHFRYGVLEAATLFVLSFQDRQPVHAAVLVRNGAGLLLAGPSGAGKSTLAYAAATRLGCRILAEDVVSVQLRPELRLWGLPGFLHLPPDAAGHFPELTGNAPTLNANGKTKIAVSLERIGAHALRPVARRAGICVLERGDGPPALEPLTAAGIVEALTSRVEPGFDLFADTIGDCVAALAARGGWRLRTTSRPADVLRLLDRVLAAVTTA